MSVAIRSMFDSIAGRYDALNRILSLGRDLAWRRKAARLLPNLARGSSLLDLCGGTGDFYLAARRMGMDAFGVVGDFSRPMLMRARSKPGFSGALIEMDALRTPFGDAKFDAVLCGFGMRNLLQLGAGLREIHRLLKPGGVFVTLEFFRPDTGFTRFFYRVPAPVFLPLWGWMLGSRREAYAYLAGSVLGFHSPGEYAAFCRETGFSRVEVTACDFGIVHIVKAIKEGQGS